MILLITHDNHDSMIVMMITIIIVMIIILSISYLGPLRLKELE